jgi:hypothetical protein
MKNVVFWDVKPCGSCKNGRFGGTNHFHHHGEKNRRARTTLTLLLRSVVRLLATANIVSSSPILVTLMMGALHSTETSVLTRTTRRNIAEDGILSYIYTVSIFKGNSENRKIWKKYYCFLHTFLSLCFIFLAVLMQFLDPLGMVTANRERMWAGDPLLDDIVTRGELKVCQ